MRILALISFLCICLAGAVSSGAEVPLAEQFLRQGQLSEGVAALTAQLEANPNDDQARFGLGVTQFLQAYEHLGQSLYRHGLRTESFLVRPAPEERELWPQNPLPTKLNYAAARKILQTFVDDMNQAEATLAKVKNKQVKLPLHVAQIKIDLLGLHKPVNAAFLLQLWNGSRPPPARAAQLNEFVIAFDRGDVSWLRGYCHFLAALGEVLLAGDGKPLFECTAHLFFEAVETPHSFLNEDRKTVNWRNPFWMFDSHFMDDYIAFIHLLRFPIKEPERMKVAHGHLLSMCEMSREMWTHYLAETDDEHEWIPNPKQTGVLRVPVTAKMVQTWLAAIDETEMVLQGKRLIPFWRGTRADRGINLKRVFHEPTEIDIPLWIQGTAATPYLENGPLTKFIEPEMIDRIDRQFGGLNFIGFGFWFN